MKNRLILSIAALLLCLLAQAQTSPPFLKVASSHRWFSGQYHELEHTNYMYKPTNPHTYQPAVDRWTFDTSFTYYAQNPGQAISRYVQTFDAQGRLSTVDGRAWFFGGFPPNVLISYAYDANGKVLTVTRQDYQSSSYINSTRVSYTYNANGQVDIMSNEYWTSGMWRVNDRTVYTYNSNNQLVEELVQQPQSVPWPWGNLRRTVYNYTGNNNTEIIHEDAIGGWSPISREFNVFDANGRMMSIESQEWVTSSWNNRDSVLLTYDNFDNILFRERRTWNGSTYAPNIANSYTWVATLQTPLGYAMASDAMKTWNSTTNIYEPVTDDDSISYFHDTRPLSVGGSVAPVQHISIYPNPAGNFIDLHVAHTGYCNAVLTDMSGRVVKMYSDDLQSTTRRLDVQDVPTGMYMLQVEAGGKVAVERVAIAR